MTSNDLMPDTDSMSPVRTRHKQLTRSSILEALAEIIVEEGPLGFSVQNVADQAGVSHRTVYRYFPNREAMCEGLVDFVEEKRDRDGRKAVPDSLGDLVDHLPTAFASFGEDRTLFGSLVLLTLSTGAAPKRVRERDRLIERIVRDLAPSIDPQEQRRSSALIRHLGSSASWMILTTRFDCDDREAAEISRHGIALAIADLKKQERRARREKTH